MNRRLPDAGDFLPIPAAVAHPKPDRLEMGGKDGKLEIQDDRLNELRDLEKRRKSVVSDRLLDYDQASHFLASIEVSATS